MMIITSQQSAVRASKNDKRVFWRGRYPPRLAAANIKPLPFSNAGFRGPAGDTYCGVVLLRAINVVGEIIVHRHPVKLGCGLVLFCPAIAAVEGDVSPTVVTIDHSIRIVRSNPKVVIVSMRNANVGISLSSIIGFIEASVENVDRIDTFWISIDARVIPRALPQPTLIVDTRPRFAAILGAEHATVFGLDYRPNSIRIGRRDRETANTNQALRHTLVA